MQAPVLYSQCLLYLPVPLLSFRYAFATFPHHLVRVVAHHFCTHLAVQQLLQHLLPVLRRQGLLVLWHRRLRRLSGGGWSSGGSDRVLVCGCCLSSG